MSSGEAETIILAKESMPISSSVLVKDWLKEGRARLDAARETLHYLSEPVALPPELPNLARGPYRN